jgi:heat shock protein HslJ
MPGGRLLNRGDLDEAFPDNPVRIDHVSMHGAVLNSLALKKYGISASTPTPAGGVIVRKPGSQEPWGLIMETAFIPVSQWGRYNNRFKIGGVKITIDASPQGRTAFFTTPYLTGGPAGEKNWRGEPTFPQDLVDKAVSKVYGLGVPLLAHTNGEAAIDMFLKAYASARKGDVSRPWNVTTIHSQFLRKDQIPSFVKYGIRPHRFSGSAARSAVHALVGGEPRFRSRWLPMRSRTSTWWRRSRKGVTIYPQPAAGLRPITAAPTLRAAAGRLTIFGGINRLNGSVALVRDQVVIGDLASTRMAGPPELMALEERFAGTLRTVNRFHMRGSRLELLRDETLVATFRARN